MTDQWEKDHSAGKDDAECHRRRVANRKVRELRRERRRQLRARLEKSGFLGEQRRLRREAKRQAYRQAKARQLEPWKDINSVINREAPVSATPAIREKRGRPALRLIQGGKS